MGAMQGRRRTHYCGDLRVAQVGQTITVAGWVQRQRDLGGLVFIDVRDHTGLLQLAVHDASPAAVRETARGVHSEFVVMATGVLQERSAKNPELPTGSVELNVTELQVLARSETPPFAVEAHSTTDERLRLQYRYIDLRRPDLQHNLRLRHRIAQLTREYFYSNGFIELETPMLIRSTPEGARDYLVPSRVHHGSFYALPQSPQLYKQLCMVAGFDRYIQLARCFRDEDLRADRQPEFTQIDLEMSFVELEDVLQMVEGYIAHLSQALPFSLEQPIPRMTYRHALETYGTDKPDIRYGMPIWDAAEALQGCGFAVFEAALQTGGVRGITAKAAYATLTRKELDKHTEFVKGLGAKGLAWARVSEDGTVSSSFGKCITESSMQALLRLGQVQPGDVFFLVADANAARVLSVLGALRVHLAQRLQLVPKGLQFLWITEIPFFDWDEETQQFVAMHHPFTAPTQESIPLLESDKANVIAQAADLTLNGIELSSGSIRITDPKLQAKIFALLGLSNEEIEQKFGFLVEAFRYGVPPHGGMGLGLDRLVMQLLGCESLRDVIAFPKLQNATEPMTACPAPVDPTQLRDVGLQVAKQKE